MTVTRDAYPNGLVLIPEGSPPDHTPAVLPLRSSSGNWIMVENDDHVDWPDGIVAWFTD